MWSCKSKTASSSNRLFDAVLRFDSEGMLFLHAANGGAKPVGFRSNPMRRRAKVRLGAGGRGLQRSVGDAEIAHSLCYQIANDRLLIAQKNRQVFRIDPLHRSKADTQVGVADKNRKPPRGEPLGHFHPHH